MSTESKKRAREEDTDEEGGLDPKIPKVSLFATDWGSEFLATVQERYTVEEAQVELERAYPDLINDLHRLEQAKTLPALFEELETYENPPELWVKAIGARLLDGLLAAWYYVEDLRPEATFPTDTQIGITGAHAKVLRDLRTWVRFGAAILQSGHLEAYRFCELRGFDVTAHPFVFQQALFSTPQPAIDLLDAVVPLWLAGDVLLGTRLLQVIRNRAVLDHVLSHPEWFGYKPGERYLSESIRNYVYEQPGTAPLVLVQWAHETGVVNTWCGHAWSRYKSFVLLERLVHEAKADISKEANRWANYTLSGLKGNHMRGQIYDQYLGQLEWLSQHGLDLSTQVYAPWCRSVYQFCKRHQCKIFTDPEKDTPVTHRMIESAIDELDVEWTEELVKDGFRHTDHTRNFRCFVDQVTFPTAIPARVQANLVRCLGAMGARVTPALYKRYVGLKTKVKASVRTLLKSLLIPQ